MKKIIFVVMMLFLKQVAFAQNDMQNMAGMQKKQPVTYTCPMHPEIHSPKPGNCPKYGMKLVKEKPKVSAKKSPVMNMPMKSPGKKKDDMAGMKMDGVDQNKPKSSSEMSGAMNMPMKDTAKKADNMSGMKMDNVSAGDMKSAKAKLGPIKTLLNNTPPHTVRYDLYIADTIVKYGGET